MRVFPLDASKGNEKLKLDFRYHTIRNRVFSVDNKNILWYTRLMIITRALFSTVSAELTRGDNGVVIYGARQVGKTTLVNQVIRQLGLKTLVLNGDERGDWWEALTSRELSKIKLLVAGYDAVFVDEAQRIPEVGLSLKIIRDQVQTLRVIVTGSSSLDLASTVSEPLTGRVYSYRLFPISQGELRQMQTPHELETGLEERLVFGSYPKIFSLEGRESRTQYLKNLVDAYLYKDLLEFGDVRNAAKIRDLLKLLAFQIGSQVSLTELGSALELSRSTVDRYIDLLEKSFVIFRMSGFSRNLRKEISKMDKIYFYDTGVRNAIIGNLNLLKDRDDGGKLWENFLAVERMKRQEYAGALYVHHYWRLSSGAELDLVEESGGQLRGFEFKYSKKVTRAPKSWLEFYPGSEFSTINRDNWLDFVR